MKYIKYIIYEILVKYDYRRCYKAYFFFEHHCKVVKMELAIMGVGCALGYYINRDGKQNRTSTTNNQNVMISPNRQPQGPLIYDSNRVQEVDEYVREIAAKKHAEKVKRMFSYDEPVRKDIYANDDKNEGPAALADISGGNFADAIPEQFKQNVKTSVKTNINASAFDPQSGQALAGFASNPESIDSSPMFRSAGFKQPGQDALHEFGGNVSLLSGQPTNMSHGNMNPMFGSSVKQPSVSNENSQVLLEHMTGMPSSDDQGTYRQKREVINPMPNNPDNLRRADISQVGDLWSRAQSSIKPSNEFISPVKAFRDAPMNTSQLRILPLNIDQTRSVNKKQVTFSGVMVPGQKGSMRGMLPAKPTNKYDLSYETNVNNLVSNRSTLVASAAKIVPGIRNLNSTQTNENVYTAPPTNQFAVRNIGGMADMYKSQLDNQVSRQMEAFTPGLGIASGTGINKGPNNGLFFMREPEKGFEQERSGQPHKNLGPRMRNVEAPGYTIRDSTSMNTIGPVNPNGMKSNTAYKSVQYAVNPTNKSMNEQNLYQGQPHKNLGMGQRKHNITNWVTKNEMNQFSHTGNPKNSIPAHMSHDAIFDTSTNKELQNGHVGIASGGVSKPVSDGGELTNQTNRLLVEGYVNNPTGVSHGRNDRNTFQDNLTRDSVNRIEFGGHYSHGKMGVGEDGRRNQQVTLKEDMSIEGRMNVPLKRDNPNGPLAIEANLRPEASQVQRNVIQRTQPLQVTTSRMPVQIRQRNVETLNPRMDTTTRITNDLYPWIKKGKDDETDDEDDDFIPNQNRGAEANV